MSQWLIWGASALITPNPVPIKFMKITSISYQAVKNLGNYESERLEAIADVVEGEDLLEAVRQLRTFVNAQLDSKVSPLIEDHNPLFDEGDADRF